MASLQDLNRRIRSVSNTRKITRAMEMVAAAKLRRAQQRIETLRPFADGMVELTARVVNGIQAGATLPLLEERDPENVCIVMFTGDRGLAGALNANVLRRSLQIHNEWSDRGSKVHWVGVGRKGVSSLQFRRHTVDQAYRGITDSPKFRDAEAIGRFLVEQFEQRAYDKVLLVYNSFESAASQQVIVQDLLPLTDELIGVKVSQLAAEQTKAFEEQEGWITGRPRDAQDIEQHRHEDGAGKGKHEADWFFEPDSAELLNRLLPTYVEQAIFRALLESTASEHGARMSAMHNATENAGEMVDDLTLLRNRVRQAEITQEILEVVGGAEALN